MRGDDRVPAALFQPIRDSRDETRIHGTVSPEEVERSGTAAIESGLRLGEDDRRSKRRASTLNTGPE